MELKLTFTRTHGGLLPANYQYELSSWIYKVLEKADEQYSDFLHNKGYQYEGKRFKMFTFSQLDLRPYEIKGPYIQLRGRTVTLTIRFHVDASLEHFIKGLFMEQRFGLGDKNAVTDFEVTGIETIAPPVFRTTMTYQCLSPICVSRMRSDRTTEYLSPEAHGYGLSLVQNLVRKAAALTTTADAPEPELPDFQFRLLNIPRKKGVHIRSHTAGHTQVIGYLFHFELTAPVELHEIGYYAGFGEKNSMGFGCVKMIG